MCVDFKGGWQVTEKMIVATKVIRIEGDALISALMPHERAEMHSPDDSPGVVVEYKRDVPTYDINEYGFFCYEKVMDAIRVMDNYQMLSFWNSAQYALTMVEIPAGTEVRYGTDLLGRSTINTKMLTVRG